VDGDPVEWGVFDCTGKAPGLHLETVNGIPQWIWCDPQGDERERILQTRIHGSTSYSSG